MSSKYSYHAFISIDPSTVGLSDLGRTGDYFSRTAKGWLKRANAAWGDSQS